MSKQLERLASPHMGKKGSLSFANKSVTFAFLSDSKQFFSAHHKDLSMLPIDSWPG
jgi:hypothetical protein